jgi:hypothetical protein
VFGALPWRGSVGEPSVVARARGQACSSSTVDAAEDCKVGGTTVGTERRVSGVDRDRTGVETRGGEWRMDGDYRATV